jgi:hypothetical protein
MSCAHMNPREACAACGAPRAEAAEAHVRELEAALQEVMMLMFAVRDGLERGVLGQHAAPGFCRCSLHELLAALLAALRDTAPREEE